ncbi:MFS transporter [Microbacterium sp. B2969]|uniref:MFS transporter n=1 Tax=Microbacterium alkaliflavum TaxID=3248839 RepID=A0ABW7QDT0_9MICO
MASDVPDGPPEPGPFAPLKQPGFRWLWPAVVVSYVGVWGQTIGAQWLLVNGPNASVTVALIQTAATLPMMLFTLPGGVIADRFDRRWIILIVQVYVAVAALSLAALTVAGLASPPVVLLFTFLVALGGAFQVPAWQATLPEIVPKDELAAATRLEMVGVNFGRSVGPAIAGLLIGLAGVPWVFVLTAATALVLAGSLLTWRRPPLTVAPPAPERFLPALRAGVRYVRHAPMVRRILLRAMMFIAPATILWALIPLVARERLDVSAGGYGALFGALGVGAIVAALTIGRLRGVMSTNTLLVLSGIVYAGVLVTLVLVPVFWVAELALVLGGAAWTATISSLNAELQLVLPAWVRARGLSVYLVTFTGSQAIASVLWGQLAAVTGVVIAFLVAAALVTATSIAGIFLRTPNVADTDPTKASYWGDVVAPIGLQPSDGPIVVTVEYTVAQPDQASFLDSTAQLRRSRLRNGASRWEFYRVAETPDTFVENFTVDSWEEHQAQHRDRLTATDEQIEQTTQSYVSTPVRARHLIPPTIADDTPAEPSPSRRRQRRS